MAVVGHFNLELHKWISKWYLFEEVYMPQSEGFKVEVKQDAKKFEKVSLCHKPLVNGFLKFDQVVTSFGFKENAVSQDICLKVNGSMLIIQVLYVKDILLVSSVVRLLRTVLILP